MTIAQRLVVWLIVALGSLLVSPEVLSQNQYLPGYVVLANGDTLAGKVMDRRETLTGTKLLRKIRFRPDNRGRRKKYRPQKLLGYRVDESIYKSLPIRPSKISLLDTYYEIDATKGEWNFLRLVSKGKINHYRLEWVDEDNGTLDSVDYFRKDNERSLIRVTQGIFGLKRKNLIEYFQDCPDLQQKIKQKKLTTPAEVADYYSQYCP